MEAHKEELGLADANAREAYVAEIRASTALEKDDRKAATQIAVDAAKTFVQIAIAFIVASVGFAQFSFRSGPDYVRYLLLASGGMAFISLCFGFLVISRAYKRGDGRIDLGKDPWSTENVRNQINGQAITGLICLLLFVTAMSLFNWGASPKQMTITLPDKTTKTIVNLEPVTISGEWSSLGITQTGFTIALDKVPPGQKREVRLDLK
ncbi:MAG: hypothetical protein WAL47_02240 [Pyrinomonadaceae bacterium]